MRRQFNFSAGCAAATAAARLGPDPDPDRYEQLDERTVRVRGSTFRPTPVYQVKLEGAAIVGQRSIFIGGIRDPILGGQIDTFLQGVKTRVAAAYPELQSGAAQLIFHIYGKNGVMGEMEPEKDFVPLEVGILGEVTAATQELAHAICSGARIGVLHMPYALCPSDGDGRQLCHPAQPARERHRAGVPLLDLPTDGS